MAQLYTKVKKYLEANSKTVSEFNNNIVLQNDTGTNYIKTWNVSGLAKPTDEQLATYNSSATTEDNNNSIRDTRKSAYGTPEQQIENIIENGLEAEQTRVQTIKDANPKE